MARAKDTAVVGYELKVTIVGTQPPVWRQLRVPARLTLDKFHRVLQAAFAWQDYHLHEFIVGKEHFASLEGEPWGNPKPKDEERVSLADLNLRRGRKFRYVYDFGDGWEHEVVVAKVLHAVPIKPTCVAGERAGPPEDSGGPWGYNDLLDAVADPKHQRHEELSEWIGEDFAPEAFDPSEINAALRRVL